MTKENLPSISKTTSYELVKAGDTIALTEKLLVSHINNRKKELYEFLLNKAPRHFTINLISRHYPLSIELIRNYRGVLEWYGLIENQRITWSLDALKEFYPEIYELDISDLSTNTNLPWNEDFIAYFRDKWDWKALSSNTSLPWSERLIEMFYDRWNWNASDGEWDYTTEEYRSNTLSENTAIPWSENLIFKYLEKWNWNDLSANPSLPWGEKLIDMFLELWCWHGLSGNLALPWGDESFLERYTFQLDWGRVSNEIPLSHEQISNNISKIDFERLSANCGIDWTTSFIEKHRDKWYWFMLSFNKSIRWEIDYIEYLLCNQPKFEIEGLSGNRLIDWDISFIEKHLQNWDWYSLSSNPSLPWSIEFIDRFKDKLDFRLLSNNRGIPWSDELLHAFKDKWDLYELSENRQIPWSIILILNLYGHLDSWLPAPMSDNVSVYLNIADKYVDEDMIKDLLDSLGNKAL